MDNPIVVKNQQANQKENKQMSMRTSPSKPMAPFTSVFKRHCYFTGGIPSYLQIFLIPTSQSLTSRTQGVDRRLDFLNAYAGIDARAKWALVMNPYYWQRI